MISQLFILSPRGDTIVARDYRHDVSRSSHDAFFRALKFGAGEEGDVAPVFLLDGVNYFHVKAGGLLLCATSRDNLPPALVLELLQRVSRVIKDYCGVLTEESLRKNFILVYELLDEMVDYGYGQSTSTEALKAAVFNDPVTPPQPLSALLRPGALVGEARAPPAAVQRSVLERALDRGGATAGPIDRALGAAAGRRAEIFVDVVERLTVTFNAAGYVLTAEVDGNIQCKSFLQGSPQIKLALNEDLVINSAAGLPADTRSALGVVVLDDATFHERVNVDSFEVDRTLVLTPPEGEFTAMSYRVSAAEFTPPFRLAAGVSEPAPFKVEVLLRMRADFPRRFNASGVTLRLPLPRCTSHCSLSLGGGAAGGAPPGHAAEYDDARKEVVWTLRKAAGGSEHTLRVRATLTQERAGALRREVGPATLTFTIPSFSLSGLAVRYLQLQTRTAPGEPPPARWVRYITTSNSYVCRI